MTGLPYSHDRYGLSEGDWSMDGRGDAVRHMSPDDAADAYLASSVFDDEAVDCLALLEPAERPADVMQVLRAWYCSTPTFADTVDAVASGDIELR